jgi:hypothetical protein
MNNGRSNENLREELEGRQMALMHLNMVGGRENYKNFHRTQIAALQRELNRRAAARRAKAQGHWKKVRGQVGARGIIGYLQSLSMAPPNRNTAGGAAYRRLVGQTTYKPRNRSRSPRRRSPNKRSPGRSPRR